MEEIIINCIEDILGYKPYLADRFRKDLDLDIEITILMLLCVAKHLKLELDSRQQKTLIKILERKTILDLAKRLKKYVTDTNNPR